MSPVVISKTARKAFAAIGRIGGKARAAALTPERRREIAQSAAKKRWTTNRRTKVAKAIIAVFVLVALASPVHAQTPKRMDWPSVITMTVGSYADTKSTTHVLPLGRCHELNSFIGPHPTDRALYLNMGVEIGALVFVNVLAERSHSKRFKAISRTMNYSLGGIHGWAAEENMRKCG